MYTLQCYTTYSRFVYNNSQHIETDIATYVYSQIRKFGDTSSIVIDHISTHVGGGLDVRTKKKVVN